MVKMIATKPHTFGGKVIQAGEEFEADAQYAPTLVSLGRASVVEENGKKKSTRTKPTTTEAGEDAQKYQTRQVKAEGE